LDQSGKECDQDDSHSYGGRWERPFAAGLIESLARPGANVTGLTNLGAKLGGKRLELLKEAVPKVARVAVIYEPATPANIVEVKEELPSAALALKLAVQAWEVRAAGGFEQVFAALRDCVAIHEWEISAKGKIICSMKVSI
jgi:ABC-type uncharacterized transport system substrate-binding protein